MDEEDITEMRADFKLVDEHEQMDLLGGTQTEMNRRGDGADVEKEYVHPSHIICIAH
jgi:G patch domain-containing protein 1